MLNVVDLPSLQPSADFILFENIVQGLVDNGYVVLPGVLPSIIIDELTDYARFIGLGAFRDAGIGRQQGLVVDGSIRRDRIRWMSEDDASPLWSQWVSGLQSYINSQLFLGLDSFECHYACYQQGDFYQRHLDSFRGQNRRKVTCITYLNEHWLPEDGGELVMYSTDGCHELARVLPEKGTLVVFLSEMFPHEVCPSQRERLSMTGWFRTR